MIDTEHLTATGVRHAQEDAEQASFITSITELQNAHRALAQAVSESSDCSAIWCRTVEICADSGFEFRQ